jgi:hypothetical protein
MSEASSTLFQATLSGIDGSISSPASAGGSTPLSSPAGRMTWLSGRDRARVSPSAAQVALAAYSTRGIYGPLFIGSSPSAVLQSSLESRLRARLGVNGSPEYVMTWKSWDMPSGPPICALRASARPISGSACTGWPSPMGRDHKDGTAVGTVPDNALLGRVAWLAGWPTPSAEEMRTLDREQLLKRRAECQARWKNGNGFGLTLGNQVTLSLASTAKHGALNPDFTRWLMGYPPEHLSCAPTVMPSCPRSRRRS